MKTLEIKWTVSRGRDTYGYNICSLWVNGIKRHSCNGGGYDMVGTCFGEYLNKNYQDKLKELVANYGSRDNGRGLYGLVFYDPKTNERVKEYYDGCNVHIDGACGFSSVERIFNTIGVEISRIKHTKKSQLYWLHESEE